MTQTYSQKRYRHHHDNAAPRFRDVPPRFKRQKSSSKSDTEENSENCENHIIEGTQSSYTTELTNQSYISAQAMKQPFKMINSQLRPGQSPALNDSPLSVDTRLYNQIPLGVPYSGPEYLCQQNFHTPPLSPWGVLNPGQMAVYPPVPNASVYSQGMRSSPAIQPVSPSLEMAKVNGDWKEQERLSPDSPLAANCSPSHPNQKQAVDHSDQDIRTIKILRELERVADLKEREDQEKESGENLDNNKRQNHVSHHLRMLMCAVDRYTEDIEEDNSPVSENVPTAALSKTMQPIQNVSNDWKVKQSKKQRPSKTEVMVIQDCKNANASISKGNTKWAQDYSRQQQFTNQQWSKSNGPQQQSCHTYSKGWNVNQLPVSQPQPLMTVATPQNKMASPPPSLMHHMLTPPPSRVSSPHPSQSQYATPMAPHLVYQSASMAPQAAMVMQSPQVAIARQSPQAVVTISSPPAQAQRPRSQPLPQHPVMMSSVNKQAPQNETTPQDSLAHILSTPQSPLMAPALFQQEGKGWDIWSSPDFFSVEPNMDEFVSNSRLPLYKR